MIGKFCNKVWAATKEAVHRGVQVVKQAGVKVAAAVGIISVSATKARAAVPEELDTLIEDVTTAFTAITGVAVAALVFWVLYKWIGGGLKRGKG